jgi:glycosyltransferase involved in cell wall biosynthesis
LYEIVVADDGPSDETRYAVLAAMEKYPHGPLVRYVPVTGPHGPAAARNCGWRAAHAEIIAFTDDDTIADRAWLSEGLKAIAQAAAVAGWVSVPIAQRPTDYELDAHGLEGAEFVTANCFVRRSALEAVGGFDERFRLAWREDSDLYFALLEHAQPVVWSPKVRVLHPVRPGSWGISLKQQRKVLFDALLYKKHPALYRMKIRPSPPWMYYAHVVALVAAIAGWALSMPWVAAFGMAFWTWSTVSFCMRRLEQTSHAPRHIAEMLLTSAVIPLLSVFWRLTGALRFRVLFL